MADELVRDPARIDAVRRSGLLDTPPEEVFDRLTRLAATLLDVPAAFISLVDADRDFYKSQVGFGEPLATMRELKGQTFCHFAIARPEPLVIPDTRADPAYCAVPSVDSLGVAAYLGVPLVTPDGQAIGSFCVIDVEPRAWTDTEVEAVRGLASVAMREIDLRAAAVGATAEATVARADRDASERAQRRLAFLYHATSTILAAKPELVARLDALAQLAVPDLCDWCVVSVRRHDDAVDHVAVAHSDPARRDLADGLRAAAPALPEAPFGLSRVFRDGESELVADVPEAMFAGPVSADEPLVHILREVGGRSYMVVPIHQDGLPFAAVSFIAAESSLQYAAEDLALAEDLCRRTGLALADARRVEERQRRLEFEQQLLGIVSHDLRNPIAVMMGSAALLLKHEDTNPGALKSLARIISGGERAVRMIRDLLDFTQARLGEGIPIARGPLNVHELIRQLVEETEAAHPERAIEMNAGGSGEGQWDRDRLVQVVGNLLDNALAYGPPQTPVRVETRGFGDYVTIAVHNAGPPIPQAAQRDLFKPLVRGTASGSGRRSIGLGLYIVDQIVRAHHGAVSMTSDMGGTTFTVRLPRT